jgi:hypothetical protein
MSRKNKVNPDHYVQRGRLTPDDAARELAKQRRPLPREARGSSERRQPVTPKDKANDEEAEKE